MTVKLCHAWPREDAIKNRLRDEFYNEVYIDFTKSRLYKRAFGGKNWWF